MSLPQSKEGSENLMSDTHIEIFSEYEDMLGIGNRLINTPERRDCKEKLNISSCLEEIEHISKETQNVITCAVIGSLRAGKSSFVRQMASRGMAVGKRLLLSRYEVARGITVHPRPYTVILKQQGKIVTFVDTSGHYDFAEETLEVLKHVDNVVFIVNALEGLSTVHSQILHAVTGKNTVLVFNKIDTAVTVVDAKELFGIISDIVSTIKPRDVFLGSMTDNWICDINSVHNGRHGLCMFRFLIEPLYKIYSTKSARQRTLRRALERFIKNKNAVFNAMESSASGEDIYVLKHYLVDDMLLPLVFSGVRIGKHHVLAYGDRAVKVERVFVCMHGLLIEADSVAPKVPSLVKFDTQVSNSMLGEKEPGEIKNRMESEASCFKVFVDSTSQTLLNKALDRLKLMYISLRTNYNVLYGTGELFLDCVVHDLLEISDSTRVTAFDVEFKETCTTGRFSEPLTSGNMLEIVCKGVECNTIRALESKALCIYRGNALLSNACIEKDSEESIVKGFKWAISGCSPCEDAMFLTVVVLQSAVITDMRSSVVVKDARDAILSAFKRGSRSLEPFLSINIFYKDHVANAVREILSRHRVMPSSEECVGNYKTYKGVVSCVDSLGLEANLLWNTFEDAFCVKQFLGYKDPICFCSNAFLQGATERLQRHRKLCRDMQDIF